MHVEYRQKPFSKGHLNETMIFHREHFLPPLRARKVTDEFVRDLSYEITIVYFLSARYDIESNLVSTAHYKHCIIY